MHYGMYVIGSRGPAGLNVMAAHWLMQVSFKPRMVALSLENDARTLANIRETRVFSVNVMGDKSRQLVAAIGSDEHDIFAVGDALNGRGWHFDRQAGPPALHLMASPRHALNVDEFIADLRWAVEHNAGSSTTAATYGDVVGRG